MPWFRAGKAVSAKEITESMAVFHAIRNFLPDIDPQDPSVTFICPGDGVLPRTSALVAFMTKWMCHSLDPELNQERYQKLIDQSREEGNPIKRVWAQRKKAEETIIGCNKGRVIIGLTHSHAKMEDCLKIPRNYSRIDCVSLVCCQRPPEKLLDKDASVRHNLKYYKDHNVWSPKNEVFIWQDLKGVN